MRRKRTPLEILRARERRRNIVPPVVIAKRRAASSAWKISDPGEERIIASNRITLQHRRTLEHLLMQSMALVNAPQALTDMLRREGLEKIKLDDNVNAMLTTSIRKVSDILLFQLVVRSLVNDKALGDKLVELYMGQRFEAPTVTRPKPQQPQGRPAPQQPDPGTQALLDMLKTLTGN